MAEKRSSPKNTTISPSEVAKRFMENLKKTDVNAVMEILSKNLIFMVPEAANRLIHVEKKCKRIEETNPKQWEDQPDGSRHVPDKDSDGFSITETELKVTDSDGTQESWKLKPCSKYKRDGDWVKIQGEGSGG